MHEYSSIEAANGARPRPSLALRPVLSPITPCATVWAIEKPYPHNMGVFNAYTQFVYLGYTVPHSIPSRPNQRPINIEYFQAQHPSRANQPRAFTSDSIQALVTP